MATNLERLRAKRAANQKKEEKLSTSFTIDEVNEATEQVLTEAEGGNNAKEGAKNLVDSSDNNSDSLKNGGLPEKSATDSVDSKPDQNIDVGSQISTENNLKDAENSLKTKKEEADNPQDLAKAINPINNINAISNNNNSILEKYSSEPEKNLGLRLASNDDKRYLNMAPLSRAMTKKSFFIILMENEFNNLDQININDPELDKFRNSSLKTAAMTISVPVTLIDEIKMNAAKHMMKYQRYIAYVIHKAMENDELWKNMQ